MVLLQLCLSSRMVHTTLLGYVAMTCVLRRSNGWIHTLLEEAENERMHLLTFLSLRQPGMLFRGAVLVAQVMHL